MGMIGCVHRLGIIRLVDNSKTDGQGGSVEVGRQR